MLYRLLVMHKGWWKQINAANEYDFLLREAMRLDDNTEWMIVQLRRYHSGLETETISAEPHK